MLVDTCATVRGNRGYCAAHPSGLTMDCGPVYDTRARAAREYAADEWLCNPEDVRVRKSRGQYAGCRYIATRQL